METGVAHPAAVVTDLTCPPDIHSTFSFCSIVQLNALYLWPSFACCLYISLTSFIFLPPSTISFSVFLSCTFSFYSFTLFLYSRSQFSLSDSWALTAFYISFFSTTVREWGLGALFKQTGGCVVRRGWRHAITNHWLLVVSGTRRTWPRYGERGPSGTCRAGFRDNQTATLATVRCGVTADGSWCINPPGRIVWRVWDGNTTTKTFLKKKQKILNKVRIKYGNRQKIKKKCYARLLGKVCVSAMSQHVSNLSQVKPAAWRVYSTRDCIWLGNDTDRSRVPWCDIQAMLFWGGWQLNKDLMSEITDYFRSYVLWNLTHINFTQIYMNIL